MDELSRLKTVHGAHPQRTRPRTVRRVWAALGDDHIATRSALARELAGAGAICTDGRHDFNELVANRKEHILEPEFRDGRVAMTHRKPEHGLKQIN